MDTILSFLNLPIVLLIFSGFIFPIIILIINKRQKKSLQKKFLRDTPYFYHLIREELI